MAPSRPSKSDHRLQAVIASGKKTLRLLKARSTIPAALLLELESHSRKTVASLPAATIATKSQALDALGTELWNASSCMVHDGDDGEHVGVAVRMFAMALLDTSHHASARRSQDPSQQRRVFKVTVRAADLCLEHGQLDLAITALERCSNYLPSPDSDAPELMEISKRAPAQANESEMASKLLEREYYLLRVVHAWKSKRLDLADHFYQALSRVTVPENAKSQVLCIKIAHLCYRIARDQFKAEDPTIAVRWSERALAVLDSHNQEDFDQEALELRLSITVAFVEQLLASHQEGIRHRARDIVDQLENERGLGNRIAVPILKLRVLSHQGQVGQEQITEALHRLIRLAILTEDNFNIVLQTLRKAERMATEPALAALDGFISNRLLPEARAGHAKEPQILGWLEKATITFVLFATTGDGFASGARTSALQGLFDKVKQINGIRFSTKATHAAQTLLWKATSGSDDTIPLASCRLLQHPVFEHAGHINKARIGRRLMRIAMLQRDLTAAREVFFGMPLAAQTEPSTAYLAFKVALQCEDQELATNSLRVVVNQTARDPSYLYACVLNAQQSRMKLMAVASLKAVIDQKPPGVQLATLLRCTARLLLADVDPASQDLDVNGQETVSIFEMADQIIGDIRAFPDEQMRSELLWWSKNAYNLTLRICPSAHPELTYRMMTVCMTFLDAIPRHAGFMHEIELTKRKMLCLFLSATVMIILGRSSNEEGEEYSLQCFLKARENITTFQTCANTLSLDDRDAETDERAFSMLKYELECILKLHSWDELPSALQSCIDTPRASGGRRWDTLADLIIIIHLQLDESTSTSPQVSELITTLLQKVINETWKKDKDVVRVSR